MKVNKVKCNLPQGYYHYLTKINNVEFTSREIDVIACIMHMRDSSKIASILEVSPRTTETHLSNIKRKIDKTARENIIDFVEKSGKIAIFRLHYQYLLAQTEFQKRLASIAILTRNKTGTCRILCSQEERSLMEKIGSALNAVGITTVVDCGDNAVQSSTALKTGEYLIYVISAESKVLPSQVTSNLQTVSVLLLTEQIPEWLKDTDYIDASAVGNYYLLVFELLKKLLPTVNLGQIISEFKSAYCQEGNKIGNVDLSSVQSAEGLNTAIVPFKTKSQRLLIVIIATTLLIATTAIYFGLAKNRQATTSDQIAKPIHNQAISSYMAELLTGYEKFIGREKELQKIEQILQDNDIVIITGQAGVGKSSLAIQYCKGHKNNWIIRYFNADSSAKIDQKYQELAEELGISIEQQPRTLIMQLVNNKLSNINTKILFILDNIDNYEDAKDYLTNLPTNVKAIVTTRQPNLITDKPKIVLDEFSNEEAKQYLRNSVPDRHLDDETVQELIESNGTLPYDIKLVAAYLIDNPSISNKEITKEIRGKIKEKLFEEFMLSSDPVRQQAWEILQYAAQLDPDFISMDIIKGLSSRKDVQISKAINKLKSLSLISIIDNKNSQTGFRIHRKLQKAVQNSMNNHPEYAINDQNLYNKLLSVLDALFPIVENNPDARWQVASGLLPHVKKVLDSKSELTTHQNKVVQASLCYKLACYYRIVNFNYQLALDYAKTSLNQRRILYKDNHQDVANSLSVIGRVYLASGNNKEALKYLEEELRLRKQLHSKDHPDIAESLRNIGSAYWELGELQKGLEYAQTALAMYQRVYSSNHERIARSLNDIGGIYLNLGDFKQSLAYFEMSLQMLKELHTGNHREIARMLNSIAYNYYRLGNYPESLKNAKAAVEMNKELYPSGNPRMIYALRTYGAALIELGKTNEGLNYLHEALDLCQKFNMDKHFITAYVNYTLGVGYFKNKDYSRALEYAKQSLDLRREKYAAAKNHLEIVDSLHSLGDILHALGDKTKALEFYQEALTMSLALSLDKLPETLELQRKIDELARSEATNLL